MKQQGGYIMISVLFALFVIATVSLNLNREGAFDTSMAADKLSSSKAKLTAQVGMNHLLSQSTKRNCSNYSDVPNTSFGSGSYTATILPLAGSPVSTYVTATMNDGSYAEIKKHNQIIYQAVKPLLSITTADGSDGDTHVSNTHWFNAYNTNYSNSNTVNVGDNILGTKNYALLKFDLSSLPSAAKILSAELHLNLIAANTNSGTAEISIFQILNDWNPTTATYNTSDGTTSWSWPDLYAASAEGVVSLASSSAGLRKVDLSTMVQGWAESSITAYGVALIANSNVNSAYFHSANSSSTGLAPKIQIQYTCECSVECENTITQPVSVAHWKLDESGGTTAYDSIGKNDGIVDKPKWTTGKIDGAASFNGSNDHIFVPHDTSLSFDKELSISAWGYLDIAEKDTTETLTIIVKGTEDGTDEYWFGIWENEIEFGILDSDTWHGVNTIESGLAVDRWHHLAVTFSSDTNRVQFYLDGAIAGDHTLTEDLVPNDDDILIGHSQYDEYWHGLLDDIRLFDHVLSASEIESLASAGGITVNKTEYVLDRFEEEKFSGDDGSIKWSGDWQEVGESDGPSKGDIRITTELNRKFVARVRDNDNGGEGIQRKANLQGCASARLIFEYRRSGFDAGPNDYVSIAVSRDNGSNWTELDKIARAPGDPATDTDFLKMSYDISAYISKETMVRFKTSPGLGGSEFMNIDNVEIRLSGCD